MEIVVTNVKSFIQKQNGILSRKLAFLQRKLKNDELANVNKEDYLMEELIKLAKNNVKEDKLVFSTSYYCDDHNGAEMALKTNFCIGLFR